MNCATERCTEIESSIATRPPRDPVVLDDVSWEDYLRFREIGDNRDVKMQYVNERLLLVQRDQPIYMISHVLKHLLLVWSERTGLPTSCHGRWTLQNRTTQAAAESDMCWDTKQRREPDASETSDLSTLPAPDLALEVDIASFSSHKFAVYASLGVDELWSWDDLTLVAHRRVNDGYERISRSIVAPGFPLEVATDLIRHHQPVSENKLMQIVRNRLSHPG